MDGKRALSDVIQPDFHGGYFSTFCRRLSKYMWRCCSTGLEVNLSNLIDSFLC